MKGPRRWESLSVWDSPANTTSLPYTDLHVLSIAGMEKTKSVLSNSEQHGPNNWVCMKWRKTNTLKFCLMCVSKSYKRTLLSPGPWKWSCCRQARLATWIIPISSGGRETKTWYHTCSERKLYIHFFSFSISILSPPLRDLPCDKSHYFDIPFLP